MDTHCDQFRAFAKYNRQFNEQLYSEVAKLSGDTRKKNLGAFFGSIHSTLNHILLAVNPLGGDSHPATGRGCFP